MLCFWLCQLRHSVLSLFAEFRLEREHMRTRTLQNYRGVLFCIANVVYSAPRCSPKISRITNSTIEAIPDIRWQYCQHLPTPSKRNSALASRTSNAGADIGTPSAPLTLFLCWRFPAIFRYAAYFLPVQDRALKREVRQKRATIAR